MRDAEHRFVQTANVRPEHGDAAGERFQHHAASCFGPDAGDKRGAGLGEEVVDVVGPRQNRDVGAPFEFDEIVAGGAPGGDGSEGHFGHAVGQAKEDRNSLHGAGVHHEHVGVIELAEKRGGTGFEQGDGNVDGLGEIAVLTGVVGDVVGDADDSIGLLEKLGPFGVDAAGIGAKGDSDGGSDEIDDAGAGGADGEVEEQLGGVVGGSDDDVGVEPVNLPLEVRTPEGRAGEGADVDVFEVESDVVGVDGGGDAARREGVTVGVVIGFAERLDAGDDPDMVTAGG